MTPETMIVGMIGVGGFGVRRRGYMRRTGHFKIAACCDRGPEALKKACSEEGATPCADFDELLATPGLEGVVIATGADTHTDLTLRALRAGLHVFVEKPLCSNEAQIAQLLEARRVSGRVVGVGHSDVHADAIYRLIRHYIDSGRLGTVAAYEDNSSHSGGLEIKKGDWRSFKENNPGGMLFQCGVHALHGLTYLFGPVASVQAMMRYDAHPGTETADVTNVLIRHESGMVGTLNCYHVTPYCRELRVFGTRGALFLDTNLRRAWFQERKRGEVEPRVEIPVPAVEPLDDCSNVINWYKACRGEGQPRPSLEDGINAVLPVFAAELAAEEGRAVMLDELRQGAPQLG
jgi:UDP-N-acetyl-2-amino-2-deoxyglucuronate dehydrogenase